MLMINQNLYKNHYKTNVGNCSANTLEDFTPRVLFGQIQMKSWDLKNNYSLSQKVSFQSQHNFILNKVLSLKYHSNANTKTQTVHICLL